MGQNGVVQTDYDLLARWEWFRRGEWGIDPESRKLCRAFAALCAEVGAGACLEGECGFAVNSLILKGLGLPVVGCDSSEYLIARARENAKANNAAIPFFVSSLEKLAGATPHLFDAVFCPSLMLEPDWQILRDRFAGVFQALRPGGFLAFTGPAQGGDWSGLLAEYDRAPAEEALWSFREGGVSCTKLMIRGARAENFADERIAHIIEEGGRLRVETTVRRLPAYWNWKIICDLARQSGYCHVETRRFPGEDGAVTLNVAWKTGSLHEAVDPHQPAQEPYADR